MDSSTFTAGNFLGGDQLTDKEKDGLALTISEVTAEEMRSGQAKLCLHFREDYKPLLINKTNAKRLQTITGSKETNDWVGKEITIWFDPEVEYMGDIVGGIRIRVTNSKKK